jgi:hypothetical protein
MKRRLSEGWVTFGEHGWVTSKAPTAQGVTEILAWIRATKSGSALTKVMQ